MNLAQAVVLGVVEGVTEFLPISSTGHLLVVEHLMGLPTEGKAGDGLIGFTAVIQVGAILAALVYFFRDIVGIVTGFVGGVVSSEKRERPEWRYALAVAVGCIPIGVVGLALKDVIKDLDKSLITVAVALIVFSAVLLLAERRAAQNREERSITVLDGLLIGLAQCVALVPGVSRSGATISAGLLRGLDRVSATRLSFLLGIPALLAAGAYELKDATTSGPGAPGTLDTVVATVVAFVVAYAAIAFLLRFVARHTIAAFVPYRVLLGVAILVGVAVT
ncbi:MAG: undecaprenyl-diphosphatase [Actinomycetota bacterium]|nr:undecaprenyl-diphosphatase [Actinomycetota bacterium]